MCLHSSVYYTTHYTTSFRLLTNNDKQLKLAFQETTKIKRNTLLRHKKMSITEKLPVTKETN